MKIGNMPEDELDDLFRKAASEYNPEFDPEAWRAMEQKLGAPKVPSRNWKRLGGLLALLLFIGLGTWVGYQNLPVSPQPMSSNKNKPLSETSPTIEPATKAGGTTSLATGAGEAISSSQLTNPKISGQKAVAGAAKPATAMPPVAESAAGQPKAGGRSVGVKWASKSPTQTYQPYNSGENIDKEENKDKEQILVGAGNVSAPDSAGNNLFKSPAVPLPVGAAALDSVEARQPLSPGSSQVMAEKAVADSAVAKGKKNLFNLARFTLSLVAAPDLSSVGFANMGGISTNAGILVGYNFAGKWRLTTGIIKARKIYEATPDDYGNKYEFWQNRHLPDDIEATCQVLDIPVNIGYQVWQQGPNSLTVNTGLSSYLMRREKYTYKYYPYGGNNGYSKDWQVNNQNKHLFSIYNFSAGYARQLSRGVMLGVEPFVKVPLAGVGAGKIKLASAGIFFSLSYRLPQ